MRRGGSSANLLVIQGCHTKDRGISPSVNTYFSIDWDGFFLLAFKKKFWVAFHFVNISRALLVLTATCPTLLESVNAPSWSIPLLGCPHHSWEKQGSDYKKQTIPHFRGNCPFLYVWGKGGV